MKPLTVTVLLAVASAAVSAIPRIDIAASAHAACAEEPRWCHKADQPWEWFYRFGPWPAVLCGVAGVVLAVAGTVRRDRRLRATGLFLAANLALGPGLLGNSTKALWGRPRPRHIEQFGGTQQYRPVWELRPGARGTSFPSGHVVTAFSLGGLSVLATSPLLKTSLLLASLVYGILMGIARVVQGAHFITDAVWSATLAWAAIAVAQAFVLARGGIVGRTQRSTTWNSAPRHPGPIHESDGGSSQA